MSEREALAVPAWASPRSRLSPAAPAGSRGPEGRVWGLAAPRGEGAWRVHPEGAAGRLKV